MKINENFVKVFTEPPPQIEGENSQKIDQYDSQIGEININLKNDKFSPIQHKPEDIEKFKICYSNFIKTINPHRLLPKNVKNLFQKKIVPKLNDEDPLIAIDEVNETNETTQIEEQTNQIKFGGDVKKVGKDSLKVNIKDVTEVTAPRKFS